MRVGIIPYAELKKQKALIKVAKYFMNEAQQSLAFFKGTGLELAEKLVKKGQFNLSFKVEKNFNPHEGLSCRWSPLDNTRGLFLSMLIKVNPHIPNRDEVISKIISHIDQIVDIDSPETHPVKVAKLKVAKLWQTIFEEAKFSKSNSLIFSFLKTLAYVGMIMGIDRGWIKIKALVNTLSTYKRATPAHCDYRKFDETLRMVIDCTPFMREKIITLLQGYYLNNQIYYGLHESSQALMTCFVESLENTKHIHFIDGADGGYCLAAKTMKNQMKASQDSPTFKVS